MCRKSLYTLGIAKLVRQGRAGTVVTVANPMGRRLRKSYPWDPLSSAEMASTNRAFVRYLTLGNDCLA